MKLDKFDFDWDNDDLIISSANLSRLYHRLDLLVEIVDAQQKTLAEQDALLVELTKLMKDRQDEEKHG